MHENLPTVVAFFDLAKAFDTIDHVLLKTLKHIDLRGIPNDFLSNRPRTIGKREYLL